MKSCIRATLVAALVLLPPAVRAGGPVFDPFVEKFAVGTWSDPATVELEDGWPVGLFEPARVDSAWFAAAGAVLRFPAETRLAALVAAADDPDRAAAWLDAAAADVAAALVPGPATGRAASVLTFFARLADGDTRAAAAIARRLADADDLTRAARTVWSLRAAALGPRTGIVWPAADAQLIESGPWDGLNTWSLAVALRRARGQDPVPAAADEDHGRRVGRLAHIRLTESELAAAPYGDDLKAGLGALGLEGAALERHLDAHATPPADPEFQGWWVRGQRRLARGDAAAYEKLARREDLLPRWRVDLWRRASERRLLAGAWDRAHDDLVAAYDLVRTEGVGRSVRRDLAVWTEQAMVGALAHGRRGDARRFLDLLDAHPTPDGAGAVDHWRRRVAGEAHDRPTGHEDRVDDARERYRSGAVAGVVPAPPAAAADLRKAAASPPWELWRRWGAALVTDPGVPAGRRAAALAYGEALGAATTPDACLAAALGRLAPHEGLVEALWASALAEDARRLTGGTAPPRPSPAPELLARLRGSRADLHALLGTSLWLGDMHGVMKIAAVLAGTGLTRDEKRRFLYPLPADGPVLEALAAAENDPALLLAIARNESAFEPAVRSRAGALGFMQVMPFHHRQRGALPGADHWSQPGPAIARGDGLVTENRRRYRGDPYRLLAAYNAGPGAAGRWDEQLGGGADRAEYAAWIGYAETRAYVEKVLIDRDVYAWILSGAGIEPARPIEE